jgi:ATP-dependent Clp protease adaptor protein ClpS
MTMVKVLVVDDPVTTMQFVVSALQEFFGQSKPEAWQTTLRCHLNGEALCAIYQNPAEADHLVVAATEFARRHGHPLSFVARPIPNWERVAGCIFAMVMKIAPNYR